MGRYNTLQSPIDYSTSEYSAYLVVDQLDCEAGISFFSMRETLDARHFNIP